MNETQGNGILGRLVSAQKTAQAVAKDSVNRFHNYKYASAEAVIEEARGALTDAGLALFVSWWLFHEREGASVNSPEKGSPAQCCGDVQVHYVLASEDGEERAFPGVTTPVILEVGRPLDKAQATALTYNMAYFLRGLLLLPREEEDASPDRRDDRPRQAPPAPAPRLPTEFAPLQLETKALLAKLGVTEPKAVTAEVLRRTGKRAVLELTVDDLTALVAALKAECEPADEPTGEVPQ